MSQTDGYVSSYRPTMSVESQQDREHGMALSAAYAFFKRFGNGPLAKGNCTL